MLGAEVRELLGLDGLALSVIFNPFGAGRRDVNVLADFGEVGEEGFVGNVVVGKGFFGLQKSYAKVIATRFFFNIFSKIWGYIMEIYMDFDGFFP